MNTDSHSSCRRPPGVPVLNSPGDRPHAPTAPRQRAFTMIEMLVVFGVIAILMAIVTAGAGYAMSKARLSRVQADLERLNAAIEQFKTKRGGYPRDNTNNPALPPLFYELTGMVISNDVTGAPAKYSSIVNGDTFVVPADFTSAFGGGVIGFENASDDPSQVQNFTGGADAAYAGHILVNGVKCTLFGPAVPAPVTVDTIDGKQIAPWNYVSTNPTNNPTGFDLWVDVTARGKTYRISNWRKDPQPL